MNASSLAELLLRADNLVSLVNHRLNVLINETVALNETTQPEALMKGVYQAWHPYHFTLPDPVFHRHWTALTKRICEKNSAWATGTLSFLAEKYLEHRHGKINVKAIFYDDWQRLLSHLSTLPIIAAAIIERPWFNSSMGDLIPALRNLLGYRSLLSPYHPAMEDYIHGEGLHDVHIHLNGSTLMEHLWNHCLLHPDRIVRYLEDSFREHEKVRTLYALYPAFPSPGKFGEELLLARRLRELLIRFSNGELKNGDWKTLLDERGDISFQAEALNESEPQWLHLYELAWQARFHYQQKRAFSNWAECAYHLYLLTHHRFQRLFVHGEHLYGVDQFQKLTLSGGREFPEKQYTNRFFQLHGNDINPDKAQISTLEGRFSPKESVEQIQKLLRTILTGFFDYQNGVGNITGVSSLDDLATFALHSKRPRFRLVAHFIKSRWNPDKESARFVRLRQELDKKALSLVNTLECSPILKELIRGVDAASNELDTPPEVFAPVFRFCRYHGLNHVTYHVGEDFEHLLCGIRAVYEALIFADLGTGDRLGHATAIGILPAFWLAATPDTIMLERLQWLESLLFVHRLALESSATNLPIFKIEQEIRKLTHHVYGSSEEIHSLRIAWELRHLRPELVSEILESDPPGTRHVNPGQMDREYELIARVLKDGNRRALELIRQRYEDGETIRRGAELEEVPTHFFTADELLTVQQMVQKEVWRRQVVIETLPTSNVRISHYKSMEEHHLFRWLKIEKRAVPGDANLMVCLGSDDPGIFSTDIKNEAYHIFVALQQYFGFSDLEALSVIKKLNERSRIYCF